MKIVVRAPNWIGDAILSLPVISSLKQSRPDAQVWIAAHDWVKDLFSLNLGIEGAISLSQKTHLKHLTGSAQELKKHEFDAGLLLTNSFSSALLFYLARIPQRWGYAREGRQILLTRSVPVKNSDAVYHQVQFYLELISGLGMKPSPPSLALPLTPEEKQLARETFLSCGVDFNRPLVMLNPGAHYGPAKRWPASKFGELAEILCARHSAEILIIGSSDEGQLAKTIASFMTKPPVVLTGKTSLRLLAGIIAHADIFITNDSGPMHMANALGRPLVAIFGPTDPRITGPCQQPSTIIKKEVACWPCSYRKCPFDHRCMMQIEPEEVYLACQKYLI